MNLIEKAFFLKKTVLFEGLDLDLLLTVADQVEIEQFTPGQKIFETGQSANNLYLLVSGAVRIENETQHYLLKEGEYFGDESLFYAKPRSYKAVSLDRVTLLQLSRSHVLTILAECPSVALALLRGYTKLLEMRKR